MFRRFGRVASTTHLYTTVFRLSICPHSCQDGGMVEARAYGGRSGVERRAERRARLLEAGLELLGNHGLAGTTLRKVCQTANLPSRYFYENFADVEALTEAVFDAVLDEVLYRGLADVQEASPDLPSKVNAALRCAIDVVADDPRKGHVALNLALASPGLAERRHQATVRIANIIADLGGDYVLPGTNRAQLLTISRFFVGGFAELLTAWMNDPTVSREELLDDSTQLFMAITSNALDTTPSKPQPGALRAEH